MFDLLKKKLSNFTKKLKQKTEQKEEIIKEKKPVFIEPEPEFGQGKTQEIRVESKPEFSLPATEEIKFEADQESEEISPLSDSIREVKAEIREEKELETIAKENPPEEKIAELEIEPKPESVKVEEKDLVSEFTQKQAPIEPKTEPLPIEVKPVSEPGGLVQSKPVVIEPVQKKEPEKKKETGFRLSSITDLMRASKKEDKPFSLPPAPEPEKSEPAELETKVIEHEILGEQSPRPIEQVKPRSVVSSELKQDNKRELKAKLGATKSLTGLIRGHTILAEGDIADLLFELELSLLESDVNHETASAFVEKIKAHLLSEKIPRGTQINEFLNEKIKIVLAELIDTEQVNIFDVVEASSAPYKILFIGPNGAGKTTTIAKLTYAFQQLGKKVIWAAGDTFRAASIEQLEAHAKKLNVRVVKHDYGADPAAVAFDAIRAAEAGRFDVVMIDSAGRQETNKNLIEELKKMNRVIKPDLKIFVGEAFAGKNLIEQARSFDEAIGIDGFVLSKIDTDAKGGTVLSLLYELKKPVFFIGTGQKYTDLIKFTPQFIIDRIV